MTLRFVPYHFLGIVQVFFSTVGGRFPSSLPFEANLQALSSPALLQFGSSGFPLFLGYVSFVSSVVEIFFFFCTPPIFLADFFPVSTFFPTGLQGQERTLLGLFPLLLFCARCASFSEFSFFEDSL